MSVTRRISLPGAGTAHSNPLDVWGVRIVVGAAVLIGVPTLIAGMVALLS